MFVHEALSNLDECSCIAHMCIIVTDIGPTRKHLATTQDVRNIERSFCLGVNGRRHDDDATSVKVWVDDMRSQEINNPVLLYEHTEDAFILVIQSKFQAELLRKYASQNVVCVDDTHGTNAYNFNLITLIVVDEYGEGFAVAWSICDKNNSESLVKFFDAVKKSTGEVNPLWFMTDDANQYYNAWVTVFKSRPTKILCSWHVLRA